MLVELDVVDVLVDVEVLVELLVELLDVLELVDVEVLVDVVEEVVVEVVVVVVATDTRTPKWSLLVTHWSKDPVGTPGLGMTPKSSRSVIQSSKRPGSSGFAIKTR